MTEELSSPTRGTEAIAATESRAATHEEPAQPDQRLAAALTTLPYRISSGDHAALGELYDATVPKLYRFTSFFVKDARDVEEVICDVYVKVWQDAEQYDATRGSVLAWLLTICRSRALDLCRRNRARASPSESPVGLEGLVVDPEGPSAIERHTGLHQAMARLSPLRQRLLWLAFFEGLTHQDIARLTGLAVGTVKSHIRRALVTLRAALEGSDENGPAA